MYYSGGTKRRVTPSIAILIMFILQVLVAIFDVRDCKILLVIIVLWNKHQFIIAFYDSLRCFPIYHNS